MNFPVISGIAKYVELGVKKSGILIQTMWSCGNAQTANTFRFCARCRVLRIHSLQIRWKGFKEVSPNAMEASLDEAYVHTTKVVLGN